MTDEVADRGGAIEEIEQVVRRFLPGRRHGPIKDNDSLAELGLNSVSLLEIVVELEDRFGVSLTANPQDLAGLDSVAAMRALVATKAAVR